MQHLHHPRGRVVRRLAVVVVATASVGLALATPAAADDAGSESTPPADSGDAAAVVIVETPPTPEVTVTVSAPSGHRTFSFGVSALRGIRW